MATSINKSRLLITAALVAPASAQNLGTWSANIPFPFVPGAAAIRPDDGRLLAWSPRQRDMHGIGQYRETFLATYDLPLVPSPRKPSRIPSTTCPASASSLLTMVGLASPDDLQRIRSASTTTVSAITLWLVLSYRSQATLSDGRSFRI